jgi:pimeloyl-ACP methyl ester carboxylesterase
MHFEAGCRGPAILLLHAFPLDGRMWSAQFRDLAEHHTVLVPDLPGFGKSPLPNGNPSLDSWARDLVTLCKANGIDRAIVAGCSLGGYLAFSIVRGSPEFASGLALVNTRALADTQDARRARYEMVERARHEGTSFLAKTKPPLSPDTFRDHPEVVESVFGMMEDATPVGVMAAQRAMASRRDSRSLLGTIRVPATVICGDDDPIIPPAEAREMSAAIPGAEFVSIAHAGHLTPIERPQLVSAALGELSKRVILAP